MSSIFTKILDGETTASFVYRDNVISAFMDIQPVNPGHVLVVPNKPVACLAELDEDVAGRLFVVAAKIAAAIRSSGIRCEGINIFLADGESAGQEVPHVHLHVVPRYVGDGFGFKFSDHYFELPPREQLEEAAESIRLALDASG